MPEIPQPKALPKLHPGTAPIWLTGGEVGCVCVHGFTASPEEMRWQAEYLHERGLTVFVPRLAGHGTNPAQMARQHWHDWYESVLDGVALVRAHCHTVFAVGLSMGGTLSLRIAAEGLIDGAVIMAAPLVIPQVPMRYARVVRFVRRYRANNAGSSPLDQRVREIQRAQGRPDYGRMAYEFTPIASVAQLYALMQDMLPVLPKITVPLLLLYSRKDRTVPLENLDLVRQGVRSTDVVVHVLEESGHVLTQDVEREAVYALVWDFIRARSR